MSQTQRKKKTLRIHKTIGKPYHQESGLVFKSREEKVVIGRCEEEVFIELDDETITLADEWKFPLDPDLVDMGSEDDENADAETDRVNTEEEVTAVDSEEVTAVDSEEEVTAVDSEEVTAVDSEEVTAVDSEEVTAVDSEEVTAVDSEEVTAVESEEVNTENNIETDEDQYIRQSRDNVEVNRQGIESSVDSWYQKVPSFDVIVSSLDKVFKELTNKTQQLSERDQEIQRLRARLVALEDDHKKLQNKWTMFKQMLSD